MFTQKDFKVASTFLLHVVEDDLERARSLEPVIRWSVSTWMAFASAMSLSGFNHRNPAHLTALQCLIDRLCDAGTTHGAANLEPRAAR